MRRQIDNWTKAGVIEKSMSPWASALVPVEKKGSDKLRWAVDYRAVNKLTVKDANPLASIETNLQFAWLAVSSSQLWTVREHFTRSRLNQTQDNTRHL